MSSSKQPQDEPDSEPEMLAAEDALEEIPDDADGDIPMGSDDEDGEEINLSNDGIAYFEHHKDSVFTIAQHPTRPTLIATGGSEGDTDDAPGKGYVFDTAGVPPRPLLPENYSGAPPAAPTALDPLFHIDGHTDSINALAFTNPAGEYLLSGGLDGRLRAYAVSAGDKAAAPQIRFLEEAQEVPEVNWVQACPNGAAHPNVVALGASDGSVWVYQVDASAAPALQILQSYFLHQAPCSAGAWTPDGEMLATVSEEGSLFVWDVFGSAAAAGVRSDNGMSVLALDGSDARFEVEGGLYSVACAPTGAFLAVGGAGGAIKVVALPRFGASAAASSSGGGSRAGGGRRGGGGAAAGSDQQGGQILASLHAQGDGVETLSFSPPGPAGTLLAAGSVDGSIALYDAQRSFQVRRLVGGAHGDFSVVKVEFVRGSPHLLTSCGMDGVVRRWDVRGTTAGAGAGGQQQQQQAGQGASASAAAAGLIKEWRGHRGDGEGGGVLGFVQGETGERVVTAGDDGVVLVFEA
ncbi:hypothetical protein RB601_001016 [Gaeumannomyces tritici]